MNLQSDLPTLLRAHAFVNGRQHKQFKKDLKSTGLSPRVAVSFEFMRANLEYLKVERFLSCLIVSDMNIRLSPYLS